MSRGPLGHRGRAKRRRRVGLRPGIEGLEARRLLASYVVTTTADAPIAPTAEVPDPLTLREAIDRANANPGPDTIAFRLPASNLPGVVDYDPTYQVWRFAVGSALPAITDPVSIDGYSQRVITGQPATDEIQDISLTGLPTGGSFTLSFQGQTTAPIPYNATADQVRAALEALPAIGPGNVAVTLGPLDQGLVSVEFQNRLGQTDVGQITGDASGLTSPPGLSPGVFATTLTQGVPGDVVSTQNALTIGFIANVRIILEGAGAIFPGLVLATDHSRVRGLAIDGFRVGVAVQGTEAVGNLIQGNYIGRYVLFPGPTAGTATPAIGGIGNGLGVRIASPTNNTVGGVAPETHNAIAGNHAQGVHIAAGAVGNQVAGNTIGILQETATLYAQLGNGLEGVLVESSSNAIGGAVAGATNIISANGTYGIHIVGAAAVRNRIEANNIGTDPGGTFIFGQGNPGNGQLDQVPGNLRDGIFLDDAPDNQVGIPGGTGGVGNPAGNVISGNLGAGVRIAGPSATGNTVQGNLIGTGRDGTSALPNAQEGVTITSAGNLVGGSTAGAGNLIAGNRRGVLIAGAAATGNTVAGNRIGTDGTGTYDLGNAHEGVRIDGAPGNTVGGLDPLAQNLISGNDLGVLLIGVGASGNAVLGNLIGTDAAGTRDLGNSGAGVRIENAPANAVGGPSAAAGNVIAANHGGVILTGPAATANAVQGNVIGTDKTATLPLGNGNEVDGVLVTDSAAQNLIGGPAATEGNTIAFNVRDGVRVETPGSVGNRILSNAIFRNGALGINLVGPNDPPGEVTPNDPGDADVGPNTLLNAPTVTSVASTSDGVLVTGTYGGPPNAPLTLQFFAGTVAAPAGSGAAGRYLGSTAVTTDAAGWATFTASLPVVVAAGQLVTATATDAAGNTSEFSPPATEAIGQIQFATSTFSVSEAGGAAVITVTRVGGSGGFATVDYRVSDGTALLGSDYDAPPGTNVDLTGFSGKLVFGVGEFTKTIAVPILNDPYPEPVEAVNLALSSPTGAGTLGGPVAATLNIVDDDLPGSLRFRVADVAVNEAEGSATITVVRDFPGIPVTVDYATAGGTATPGADYQPVAGTLAFGQGETIRTFTIPLVDDTLREPVETVGLVLSHPTGGATLAPPAAATLTIQDDTRDRTGPTVQGVRVVSTGRGRGISALILTFSKPLDPSTAADLANYGYSVRSAGRDRRLGTRDDQLIGLRSATYDPAARTVTLVPSGPLHLNVPIRLAVDEATDVPGRGVSDPAGNLLDGDGDGHPGGAFVATVVGRVTDIVHPARHPRVHRRAHRARHHSAAAAHRPRSHHHRHG